MVANFGNGTLAIMPCAKKDRYALRRFYDVDDGRKLAVDQRNMHRRECAEQTARYDLIQGSPVTRIVSIGSHRKHFAAALSKARQSKSAITNADDFEGEIFGMTIAPGAGPAYFVLGGACLSRPLLRRDNEVSLTQVLSPVRDTIICSMRED